MDHWEHILVKFEPNYNIQEVKWIRMYCLQNGMRFVSVWMCWTSPGISQHHSV